MRKQPPGPPPEVTPVQKENTITQVREYQLITPLFGGGVTPGECDPVTVIRGTEIRGQLRFWWRATRGGKFKDLAEMKKAEDKLWGAPYKKGEQGLSQDDTVQIAVEVNNQGVSVKPFKIEKDKKGKNQSKSVLDSRVPAYAAFPLQPSQDELKQSEPALKAVQANITFRLNISFPASKRLDIEAALWAWETFGGIGARTRRGFGALRLLKVNNKINTDLPYASEIMKWLDKKVTDFVAEGQPPKDIPYLSSNMQFRVTRAFDDEMKAWGWLIKRLSSFRQIPDGRDGRSKWPEAEAIREITGRRYYKYQPLRHPHKFPRAAFGLPIIFHFKDAEKGDPIDTTLQRAEETNDRLSSPLILRPLACIDNRAVGLALLLEGTQTPPRGLQVVWENSHEYPVEAALTKSEANQISVLNGDTDVLQAFMNYLGGNTR